MNHGSNFKDPAFWPVQFGQNAVIWNPLNRRQVSSPRPKVQSNSENADRSTHEKTFVKVCTAHPKTFSPYSRHSAHNMYFLSPSVDIEENMTLFTRLNCLSGNTTSAFLPQPVSSTWFTDLSMMLHGEHRGNGLPRYCLGKYVESSVRHHAKHGA